MNFKDFFKTKAQSIPLSSNQVVSMRGGLTHIACVSGALFVTWPKGKEKILLVGECVSLNTRGKICVMAFSPSTAHVQQEGRWQSKKHYGPISPLMKWKKYLG